MTSTWSRRQEDASGQQIEPCAATHLALEQLQAIEVPFDWSLTPGQRHPSLDGGQIQPQPSGEAPEGRQRALGGACQPRIELGRLAPADQPGNVLRERHRLRQCGRVRGESCSQLLVPRRTLVRRPEDQPRRAARGERAWWGCRHCRDGLMAAALPRC